VYKIQIIQKLQNFSLILQADYA